MTWASALKGRPTALASAERWAARPTARPRDMEPRPTARIRDVEPRPRKHVAKRMAKRMAKHLAKHVY